MNIVIQNILVLIVFAVSAGYLIKKFLWKPAAVPSKKKSTSPCNKSSCGCH